MVEKYKKDIDMYNKEKAKGNTEVSPPAKPEGYDEKSKRHADVTTRDKNEKSGGGPIVPNGAWAYAKNRGFAERAEKRVSRLSA